ncbi:hypothetical protein L873DRAFT_1789534 [Choiromyces venosus 120613-1]|uniref:Mid2 domain-containing protein n=1 Tax=Choiromyces venosus 120613-1 TaxID=1336337 RepID=A0A3N4JQQ9_9PEZI|nr:hypothetical protein L873DRAFT_1789534 [Choiromyces venosus 120613-1]
MSSNFFVVFTWLIFLVAASVDAEAAGPMMTTTLLRPRENRPPMQDCSTACQLVTLSNESGRSIFSKLCGAAIPDRACTKSGQLETNVTISGAGAQDILLKCLCSTSGDGVELSRSAVSVGASSTYIPPQKPSYASRPMPAVTATTLGTSIDRKPDSKPSSTSFSRITTSKPEATPSTIQKDNTNQEHSRQTDTTASLENQKKAPLSPGAAAGIAVAALVTVAIFVAVGFLAWRRHIKTRGKEPDFESVWDGQRFPRNIPVIGKRFK